MAFEVPHFWGVGLGFWVLGFGFRVLGAGFGL